VATKDLSQLKVAIVHDWLVGGGAEKVVAEISQLFPNAPIYTSYCSPEWRTKLAPARVITGYLQHWPFSILRKFLPILRQHWFSHLDLSGYDLVISSSGNGEAKGIRVPKSTTHVCYCHTPTHFYWRNYSQYLAQPGFGVFNPVARLGLKLLVGPLRRWDLRASKGPDYYIANSKHIQADIKKYYGRDSVVVPPPVAVDEFIDSSTHARTGFVVVGRQQPYKRIDLAVAACTTLELPLTVVGRGPEHNHLVAMAGPSVRFDDNANRQAVIGHLQHAEAFIFPALEDFGITPVEAMAAGTPVIAYKAGGALDYVEPGITGEFFTEQSAESLAKALQKFAPKKFNSKIIQDMARKFSPAAFRKKFLADLEDFMEQRDD
jgi:glycosyltransferase involved in cell wall biosynthesis